MPLSRPGLLDFLLMFVGLAFSLYLAGLSGLRTLHAGQPGLFEASLAALAPPLVFLPLGVVLLWPIFHLIGRISGRTQPLAAGEWLWGLAWLVSLFLVIWIIWKASGSAPEGMTSDAVKTALFAGYAIYLLAMGVVALLVWIVCLFSSRLLPWTHTLALSLLMWPMAPMALIWLMGWRLEFVEPR